MSLDYGLGTMTATTCYKCHKLIRNTIFIFLKNVTNLDIEVNIPDS